MTRTAQAPRAALMHCFEAALAAVHPRVVLADSFASGSGPGDFAVEGRPVPAESRIFALAIGKAAAAMARELEAAAGPRLERGLVITRDGHALALGRCETREAGHPVPDERSATAGAAALALARATGPGDTLIVLLSGGASALVSLPIEGVSIEALARTNRLLLASGAEIDAFNCVRKHLGVVGGGQLARAAGAGRIEVLAISDVPGDRLDVIGSGPCSPDPTTWRDALEVLRSRGILEALPDEVRAAVAAGVAGDRAETPKPGEAGWQRVRARVVASNALARAAAVRAACASGVRAVDAGELLRGEAREVGGRILALARECAGAEARPCIVVAGGETTVSVRGRGRGGRSQELALAASITHAGAVDWALLAVGSDGSDGPTDAAGAFVDGATVGRARAGGSDPDDALERNDSYTFFSAEGGLVRTGPTHTNVMDLALLWLGPESGLQAGAHA